MADPDVSSNPSEFQKVAMAAAELEPTVTAYVNFKDTAQQLEEAKEMLREECMTTGNGLFLAALFAGMHTRCYNQNILRSGCRAGGACSG